MSANHGVGVLMCSSYSSGNLSRIGIGLFSRLIRLRWSATEFSAPFLSMISMLNSWIRSIHRINLGFASGFFNKNLSVAWPNGTRVYTKVPNGQVKLADWNWTRYQLYRHDLGLWLLLLTPFDQNRISLCRIGVGLDTLSCTITRLLLASSLHWPRWSRLVYAHAEWFELEMAMGHPSPAESASVDLDNYCDASFGNAFPLLKVAALAFPLGFGIVCEGPLEMVSCLELAFSIVVIVVARTMVLDIVESVVDNLLVLEFDSVSCNVGYISVGCSTKVRIPVSLTSDFRIHSSESSIPLQPQEDFEWLDDDVLKYRSLILSSYVERLARSEDWVHPNFAASYAIAPCSSDEWSYQSAQNNETDFIYMYETVLYDLGVILPFDDFAPRVLQILGVAPSQLHSNSWATIQAFRIVCRALFNGTKQVSLSPNEQTHLDLLEEFPKGMNCKKIMAMIFEPHLVSCLLARKEKAQTDDSHPGTVKQVAHEASPSPASLGKRKQLDSRKGSRKNGRVATSSNLDVGFIAPSAMLGTSEGVTDALAHIIIISSSPIVNSPPSSPSIVNSPPLSPNSSTLPTSDSQLLLPPSPTTNLTDFRIALNTNSFQFFEFNP
ncbi:hypothetical protein CR513_43614, partial [Mucuna pruriens]